MIDYLHIIKVLDGLMLELIGKGADIPRHISEDLRSGRSLAGICTLQTGDYDDVAPKVMVLLESIGMNLLSLAEERCGIEYAEEWQRRIIGAYSNDNTVQQKQRLQVKPKLPTFVTGVPKGEYWIRIDGSELSPVSGDLDEMLTAFGLTANDQDDGYILLYGSKDNVSSFLKDIRRKVGKRKEV